MKKYDDHDHYDDDCDDNDDDSPQSYSSTDGHYDEFDDDASQSKDSRHPQTHISSNQSKSCCQPKDLLLRIQTIQFAQNISFSNL